MTRRLLVCAAVLGLAAATPAAAIDTAISPVSFRLDVKPILDEHCAECHHPGGEGFDKSGFDVTSYEGVMRGTRHGPVVVPGSGSTSNLMVLIEGLAAGKIRMPHDGPKLPKEQRNVIRRWINQGAKDN